MSKNLLHNPTFHLLLVIILGTLGYSNTLNVPFQFDDVPNIVENPVIKNLDHYLAPSKAQIYKGSTEYPMLIKRYIGSLTFALNYKINGLDVTGYHVVNLVIHLITALLLYWFVRLIFRSLSSTGNRDNHLFNNYPSTTAFFASLLFVTHPIQTQAVTYIIQRFTSLAAMFYLFAIIMYIKARLPFNDSSNQGQGVKIGIKVPLYYLISLLAAVLAMKTKEIAFTLPAMIVLYEFLFFRGKTKHRVLYLAPFVVTMLIIPATMMSLGKASGDIAEGVNVVTRLQTDMPRLDYLFTEFRVIMTYIRLIFFPVGQNLDYDYPLYHSISDPEVFLSFASLLFIACAAIYCFYRYRKTLPVTKVVFFGTAWFFATLSVESSVIPIVDVIFEHRMYLPSLGLFLVIGLLLAMVIEKCRQKKAEVVVFLSVIIASLVFTGITHSRNNVWNNKVVFWQDVVNKSPNKARGYNYLGLAHYEEGNLEQAIKHYEKCVSLAPSYANAYSNLGIAYYDKGLIDEAITAFRAAIKADPSHADAHYNLGIAYGTKGLMREAYMEMRRGSMLKK